MGHKRALYGVLTIIILGGVWLIYASYEKGAQKNPQEDAAHKAAAVTAKSENPFQTGNPLSGVKANPFEKTKKVLNPFEQ